MRGALSRQLLRTLRTIYFESRALCFTMFGLLKVRTVGTCMRNLEIGAGNSTRKAGFVTCDLSFKSDFPFDLRGGLPFRTESMEIIYAEHVLEHFSYKELTVLLKECYRVLVPGGKINIVVPDAGIFIQAYGDDREFDREKLCLYDWGLSFRQKIDYLNYIFYMDGHHRHMFDREGIMHVLEDHGFCGVTLRDFDPGFDLDRRRHESIYVLGTKPPETSFGCAPGD